MHYTRSVIGLLTGQYRSVLRKCFLINCCLYILTNPASAVTNVDTYEGLSAVLAASSDADVVFDTNGAGVDLDGASGIVIGENQSVKIQNIGTEGEAYWTEKNGTARQITNNGELSINNLYYENNVINTILSKTGSFIYNEGHITSIIDSNISNNQTSTINTTLWGGIINNNNGSKIDLIKNIVFENNKLTSGKSAPHGGLISNAYDDTPDGAIIDVIDNVIFSNNTMTGPSNQIGGAHGGAIDNQPYGYINKINNSVFKNNYIYRTGTEELSGNYHASAAALDNYNYIGEISNTLFEGNHVSTESISAGSGGGAIMSLYGGSEYYSGHIGKMENLTFIHNYIETVGNAGGGALTSGTAAGSETAEGKAYIGYITGSFIDNYAQSSGSYALGGAINNDGEIGYITADFTRNYAKGNRNESGYIGAMGGAVYNYDGKIGNITGNFSENYAYNTGISSSYGGAIYNRLADIANIIGDFSSNYAKSLSTGDAQGGAVLQLGEVTAEVYELATIKSLRGNFSENYALSNGRASGGAISNNNISQITEGIFGDFKGNYAKSTGTSALARGGAVLNFGYIKSIIGNLSENYAESSGSGAIGGALANFASNNYSLGIDELSGAYVNNHATATADGYAYGGAIYNQSNNTYIAAISSISNSAFTGNYASSENGTAQGGAIWNSGTIGFAGTNSFSNNYINQKGIKTPNDIYNKGTITLNENAVLNINDGINGDSGEINMNSGSVLNLNGYFSDNTLTVNNAEVCLWKNGSFGENVTLNINAGSLLAIEPAQITVDSATFASGSTLSLKVTDLEQSGVLYAKNLSIADDGTATININVSQGLLNNVETKDVQILKADNDFENTFKDEVAFNNMYSFVKKEGSDGWYTIIKTTTAEDVIKKSGGTQTEMRAAKAWVDGDEFSEGSVAAQVTDALSELAQHDSKSFKEEISVIAPQETPEVQAISTDLNDKLFTATLNHLSGNDTNGLSSGDALQDVSIWAKGYYGTSKLSNHGDIKGFDAKNRGVIVGVDKELDSSVKVGIGFQYNYSDIDSFRRNIEIDTLSGFVYGEYKPRNWFINAIAGYGKSDYKEKKYALGYKNKNKYSADIYSFQVMTGQNFAYITPEVGTRYYHIKRHGYTDDFEQKISGSDMNILRGVAGLRTSYQFGIIKPEIYAGLIYDIVNDKDTAVVSLPNGSSYTVDGKGLNRLGAELGGNITAYLTDNMALIIGYEGNFRKHYQDHTGLISAKYKF